MLNRHFFVTLTLILIGIAATLAALNTWGDLSLGGAIALYLLIIVVVSGWIFWLWFKKNAYILVDEMDTAVIFYKKTNNFAYFIDSAPSRVMDANRPYNKSKTDWVNSFNHWRHQKDPFHHFIDPFQERVESRIPKRPLSVTETIENIRTKEGIPIKISWTINYKLDITLINSTLEANMCRALPDFHSNMMKGNTTQILRHIIEQENVKSLYAHGAIERLETTLTQRIDTKMKRLGFTNIDPRVGPILVPKEVENAIEAAHERELKTETTAICLEKIRLAIRTYNDKDLAQLSELERLRLLDQHGVSMIMNLPGMGFPSD